MSRKSTSSQRSGSARVPRKRESMNFVNNIKPLTSDEQSKLRKALLSASDMKTLNEMNSPSLRLLLLKRKIELCLVTIDWHNRTNPIEAKLINNKRQILLEILEFYGQRKFKSMDLLKQSFKLLYLNLFRPLPDPKNIRTDPNDDEMDFREPSWDHLVLIYEIAFHVVTNTEIDKKIMQKQLKGNFLRKLVHLFHSLDDREPQYVKIILHAIYGRFMALRKDIRLYLSEYCFAYIYETRCSVQIDSNTSIQWQGIPEILAIFCSIIQGLNVPVKTDYHCLLRNVLTPLHKTYHVDAFHEELVQCCTQFILKDARSTAVLLGGMLKFWPATSPLKEQLFMDEIVHLLSASTDYIEQLASANYCDRELEQMIVATTKQLCKCMQSPHHQVSERALLIWREEPLKLCLEVYGEKCWSFVHKTLRKVADSYWLPEIRNLSKNIILELQTSNPQLFRIRKVTKIDASAQKKKARDDKWKQLRQLAVQSTAQATNYHAINV